MFESGHLKVSCFRGSWAWACPVMQMLFRQTTAACLVELQGEFGIFLWAVRAPQWCQNPGQEAPNYPLGGQSSSRGPEGPIRLLGLPALTELPIWKLVGPAAPAAPEGSGLCVLTLM